VLTQHPNNNNILTTIIAYYKKILRTFLAANRSTSLQTTLAADAHLAE
jgi:hypothetical protein